MEPERCGATPCEWAGFHGAGAGMPPGHHWHDTGHGGYLAHDHPGVWPVYNDETRAQARQANPSGPTARAQGIRLYLTGDHEELYYTSPTFHAAIEQLANWLPLWVDAMATAAVQTDEDMRQRTEDARRLLATRLVLPADPPPPGPGHDSGYCTRSVTRDGACTIDMCGCICHVTPHVFTPEADYPMICATCERSARHSVHVGYHQYTPADINTGNDLPCCDRPEGDAIHITNPDPGDPT